MDTCNKYANYVSLMQVSHVFGGGTLMCLGDPGLPGLSLLQAEGPGDLPDCGGDCGRVEDSSFSPLFLQVQDLPQLGVTLQTPAAQGGGIPHLFLVCANSLSTWTRPGQGHETAVWGQVFTVVLDGEDWEG